MSGAARSIIYYSIYLGSLGLLLAVIPNLTISTLGLPPTDEVWIRLFGVLALVLGIKGIYGGRNELRGMMRVDVYTRLGFSVYLAVLLVVGLAPPVLIIIGVIDLAAAVWTLLELRKPVAVG